MGVHKQLCWKLFDWKARNVALNLVGKTCRNLGQVKSNHENFVPNKLKMKKKNENLIKILQGYCDGVII